VADNPATGYNERVYEVVAQPEPSPAQQCGADGKDLSRAGACAAESGKKTHILCAILY
jgi:hypothetical protein